ncbi:hypothetical protein R5R35_006026 [Gryllus longicercus]|uniref:Regucalcin n=1 Tax=Gryllus longicercus TaxID=2509291 RepID=A0AAN9VMT0_9ORTH
MPVPKVERVTQTAILGESPHWEPKEKALYWVDIPGCEVRRYDPVTQEETGIKIDDTPVSFVLPVVGRKGQFVIGHGHDVAVLSWDGRSASPSGLQTLARVDTAPGQEAHILNDGKADATGRLWAGTLGTRRGPGDFEPGAGSLYSLTRGHDLKKQLTGLTIANGLAWSHDKTLFYYIDSPTKRVDVFDFDVADGNIANRRTAFDFVANHVEGVPDGMTIDADGMLWVACFGGNQVVRCDPSTGKLLARVPIPALKVTAVAFGGERLDELFVTTAHKDSTAAQRQAYPQAGSLFRVRDLGVTGVLAHPVVV